MGSESSLSFMSKDLKMTVISRRSKEMAGTRYNARGLDEQGHVANFVETELIMNYNKGEIMFAQV